MHAKWTDFPMQMTMGDMRKRWLFIFEKHALGSKGSFKFKGKTNGQSSAPIKQDGCGSLYLFGTARMNPELPAMSLNGKPRSDVMELPVQPIF